MSQFQENLQANRWMDGRMDKPYFIGPFWPRPAVKKAKKKKKKSITTQLSSIPTQLFERQNRYSEKIHPYLYTYLIMTITVTCKN